MNGSLFVLAAALLSNFIAQGLKPVFLYIRTGKFDIHETIACGGFPSSHTSTVVALMMAGGFIEGFSSSLFAVTAVSVSYTHLDVYKRQSLI